MADQTSMPDSYVTSHGYRRTRGGARLFLPRVCMQHAIVTNLTGLAASYSVSLVAKGEYKDG